MFRSLLVPLDGTPFGEHALPLAVSVARQTGATVHLLHVHVPTLDLEYPALLSTTREREESKAERDYLAEMAGRLRSRMPGIALESEVIEGAEAESLADALLKHAEEVHADLFVLSSHGRGGLSRWWYGSLANDLLRRSSRPLLLAHAPEGPSRWDREPVFRRILIPLDGSPLAEKVLPAVMQLGTTQEMEYALLRVVEPALLPVIDPTLVTAAPVEAAVIETQQEAARMYLRQVADRLRTREPAVRCRTHVLLDAQPADAILSFAQQPAGDDSAPFADLIALATHGRGGLTRLLLGSVADNVLQQTLVPLLLQRPAGDAEP